MLRKLLKECEETRNVNNNEPVDKVKKTSGSNVNDVDIFSMLTKAQKDFNTSRNIEGGTIIRSNSPLNNVSGPLAVPLGPDVTSQSVMDFFAKAKVNNTFYSYLDVMWNETFYLHSFCIQVNTGHFKAGDPPTQGSAVAAESKPLLARLMSHPAAHTLEHIEKQQRSITPQPSTHQSQSATICSTNRSKRRNKATPQQESVISTSTSISQDLPLPVTQSITDSNGPTGFLRIQSPTSTTLKNHQSMNVANTNSTNPLASLFAHASGNTVRKKKDFTILYTYVLIYVYFNNCFSFLFNSVIEWHYSTDSYIIRKGISASFDTSRDVCRSQSTRSLEQIGRTIDEKSAFTSVQLPVEERSRFHQQASRGLCQIVWRDTFLNLSAYCIITKDPLCAGCDW